MIIWSGEIIELERLNKSFNGRLPEIAKELEQLIGTQDPNVVMLYSRRCLEVIITDLCETELKRPRKTEPLKGIIDKLNSEEKVPSHIINSMLSLNSMANYGAHPKDFDPEQVKPVLNNLAIIIKWYLKYKDFQIVSKTEPGIKNTETNTLSNPTKKSLSNNKRVILLSAGILIGLSIVWLFLLISNRNNKNLLNDKELEKTIAVLPFRNLSNDSSQIYFCDGFMDEVHGNLQSVKGFKLRSRISTDQYRKLTKTPEIIGREMKVNYLIDGSIAWEGKNLKISVNLTNVKTNESIWSRNYLRELEEIFSLQSEIAKEIAGELKTLLTPEEILQIDKTPTENLEAYEYFIHGNEYYWKGYEKQNFEIAIKMYEKAIELDPVFAKAYIRLSDTYLQLNWFYYDKRIDRLTKSKEAIDAAFKINRELPDAYKAIGNYYYLGLLDYAKALENIGIAEEKLKNDHECIFLKANIYRRAGKWSLAKENYLKAYNLDPGSAPLVHSYSVTLTLLSEYTEAEKYFKKAISLNPTFIEAFWQESLMYMKWKGNTIKSRETIEEAFTFNENIMDLRIFETKVLMDIYDGQYQEALTELSLKKYDIIDCQFYINLKSLLYARTHRMRKEPEIAKNYYKAAIVTLDSMLIEDSLNSRLYSAIGIAYAGLGNKEKAIKSGKRGVELMQISKEAFRGVLRAEDLARIYVMVGEYDKALELIDQLLKIPSRLSVKLLKLDPDWKPLWNLPEFNKLTSTYDSGN